jgi:ubiquinol-cytochrome c reductase cytochrome c subunit
VKALAARRRHPLAGVLLLLLGLMVTGAGYAAASPSEETASYLLTGNSDQGEKLFLANCSTCHGVGAVGGSAGPSLIGVGAASVDFQVGTGRMPMEATAPQAPRKEVRMTQQDIADLSAYVAGLGPGPGVPDEEYLTYNGSDESLAEGAELFRVNCAMCHNVVGAGGALTRGKWAPPLRGVEPSHIYEAMVTGPQSMPVFNDANISPEQKQSIISYLTYVDEQPSPGGLSLGSLGPVSEGLFVWLGLLPLIIACTIWLGAKSS